MSWSLLLLSVALKRSNFFVLQLPPSSVPIPPKKITEKQEDFERLRNTCTSLVERIEVSAAPVIGQASSSGR